MVNTLASQSHHIYQRQEKVFAQPDFLIWLLPRPSSIPETEEEFPDAGTTPGGAAPSAIPTQEQTESSLLQPVFSSYQCRNVLAKECLQVSPWERTRWAAGAPCAPCRCCPVSDPAPHTRTSPRSRGQGSAQPQGHRVPHPQVPAPPQPLWGLGAE